MKINGTAKDLVGYHLNVASQLSEHQWRTSGIAAIAEQDVAKLDAVIDGLQAEIKALVKVIDVQAENCSPTRITDVMPDYFERYSKTGPARLRD